MSNRSPPAIGNPTISHDRRSVLSAVGLLLPLGFDRAAGAPAHWGPAPVLRLRTFEEGLRCAFEEAVTEGDAGDPRVRRIEIGHGDVTRGGVQGCYNDRPFAGFAARSLRIVRSGCEAGPIFAGVRLYVCTVDVALWANTAGDPGRPLDFASLPPAPVLGPALSEVPGPEVTNAIRTDRRYDTRRWPQ